MQVSERLQQLEGKTWMYNTVLHSVAKTRVTETGFDVVSDKGFMSFKLGEVDRVMKEFLPVADETERGVVLTGEVFPVHSVVGTIMEGIEKLKQDKDFIPQAEAINRSAQTIINLAKVLVDVKKLRKG